MAADGSVRWLQWVDHAIRRGGWTPAGVPGHGPRHYREEGGGDSLRQSDERFQLVLRATRAVIYDWDLKTDTLWWSQNGLRLFGYADERRLDNSWWASLLHPEDREPVTATLRETIAGGQRQWDYAYRLRRGDGSST